jgi:site-specific recombinase XerD
MAGDFRLFQAWCVEAGVRPFPASVATVAAYLDALERAGRRPATMKRHLASLAHLHVALGHADPTRERKVRLAMRRAARRATVRPRRRQAVGASLIEALLAPLGDTLLNRRDRAVLLVARDTMCRRLELTQLRAEDVAHRPDGTGQLLVRRSKSDPLGEGRVAWLAPETVLAVAAWTEAAGIVSGPLFRATLNAKAEDAPMSLTGLARRFKVLARRAGLDPARLSCHSTRIGTAVDLVASGASLVEVQLAGGWRSPNMPALYAQELLAHMNPVARLHGSSSRDGARAAKAGGRHRA